MSICTEKQHDRDKFSYPSMFLLFENAIFHAEMFEAMILGDLNCVHFPVFALTPKEKSKFNDLYQLSLGREL